MNWTSERIRQKMFHTRQCSLTWNGFTCLLHWDCITASTMPEQLRGLGETKSSCNFPLAIFLFHMSFVRQLACLFVHQS